MASAAVRSKRSLELVPQLYLPGVAARVAHTEREMAGSKAASYSRSAVSVCGGLQATTHSSSRSVCQAANIVLPTCNVASKCVSWSVCCNKYTGYYYREREQVTERERERWMAGGLSV